MNIIWAEDAWEDYLYWQANDKNNLKQINKRKKSIRRTPFEGIGKPEPLKHDFSDYLVKAHYYRAPSGL